MKSLFILLIITVALPLCSARAASPAEEKAFVESYKKALEAGDAKALAGFLYTEGAQPEADRILQDDANDESGRKSHEHRTGDTISSRRGKIQQTDDHARWKVLRDGLKPTKQLVIVSETKDANGSNKSTSKSPVAEKNGKLVIPVPVPAKK
jgi:hypothetical protein